MPSVAPSRVVVAAARRRFAILASSALAACAASPALSAPERAWRAMAVADPLFGGGATFEHRLFLTSHFAPAGDPLARAAFVAQLRLRADAKAFALARELVAADLAAAALDFLVSPPATASRGAEGLALAGDPCPGDGCVGQMLAQCADSEGVGPAALTRARDVLTADPTEPAASSAGGKGARCRPPATDAGTRDP